MTPWVKRKRLGAVGNLPKGAYQLLFKALATLYPVEFVDAETRWNEPFDAVVVLNGNLNAALNAAAQGTAAYVQVESTGHELAAGDRVQFGTSDSLDPVFRGQSMTIEREMRFQTITPLAADEVLASVGDRALWVSRDFDRGSCQIVGTQLPVIH